MFRGIRKFKCDNCGNKFWGPDMEYQMTIYSAPVRCPKCGSMHTAPNGNFNKSFYREIWDRYDQRAKESQTDSDKPENSQNSN